MNALELLQLFLKLSVLTIEALLLKHLLFLESFPGEILERALLLEGNILDAPCHLLVQIFNELKQLLQVFEPFHQLSIFFNCSRHGSQLGLEVLDEHFLDQVFVALFLNCHENVRQVVGLHDLGFVEDDPRARGRYWRVRTMLRQIELRVKQAAMRGCRHK